LTRDVQDMHAERDALRGEVSKLQAALARLEKEIQDRESKTNTLSGPQGLVTGRDSLLEGILEYSSAFIYMKDLEGRYIMPSGKTTGFHRRTEDIVGKTAYDVYPREVADVFVAHDRVVIETDTQQEFEETFYLEDGIFSLLSVIFPVRDSTGKTYAVCGISTDITERRRAEEAYHVLVNNSLQGLAIYRDDRIVFANPAMSEITGYSPAELLELANPVDVLAHPLDIEFIRNQFRDRSNSKPFASPVEYRIAHKDGGVRWVETNTIQIAYEGKPALQVVYLDVTDRKHAESILEEQRILAETLGDIASILNSTLDLDEVLERILANVERVVPNDAVCVMLIDEDSKSARVARQKNHSETGNAEPFVNAPIDISDNPELKAMIKGTAPVVMPEVYKMFKWVRSEDHGWISSYAGVPITFGTKVIGFLNLVSATPRFFDTILAQRLQAFASQASIAISNARLYSQAHDLAALNERQRLAREMHDSVSQTLFSASVVAETLPRLWAVTRRA